MTEELSLNTTYQAILEAARNRKFLSYGDLAKANGLPWNAVRYNDTALGIPVTEAFG